LLFGENARVTYSPICPCTHPYVESTASGTPPPLPDPPFTCDHEVHDLPVYVVDAHVVSR
jgi:hypothetical protein